MCARPRAGDSRAVCAVARVCLMKDDGDVGDEGVEGEPFPKLRSVMWWLGCVEVPLSLDP